ncbi:hypothetical protein CF327_g3745 [Tilletia walkeri]|nr:hypothetical protein CF327_g3745 [Tilletia walkeri]
MDVVGARKRSRIEAAAAGPRFATHRDSLRLVRQGDRRTVKGQGSSVEAEKKTTGELPVKVKLVREGEEEGMHSYEGSAGQGPLATETASAGALGIRLVRLGSDKTPIDEPSLQPTSQDENPEEPRGQRLTYQGTGLSATRTARQAIQPTKSGRRHDEHVRPNELLGRKGAGRLGNGDGRLTPKVGSCACSDALSVLPYRSGTSRLPSDGTDGASMRQDDDWRPHGDGQAGTGRGGTKALIRRIGAAGPRSVTHRNSLRLVLQGPRRRCGDGKTDGDGSRSQAKSHSDDKGWTARSLASTTTVEQGSKTEVDSIRRRAGESRCLYLHSTAFTSQVSFVNTRIQNGQEGYRLWILGVKMGGKAREIIAMTSRRVKARARQLQDGRRLAEGAGREDKACKTSETAHARRADRRRRYVAPITGRHSGRGAKTRHLRDGLEARDTGSGMARLVAEGPGLTGKVRKTTAHS